MAEMDVSDLIKLVLTRTKKKTRNPGRHPSTSEGRVDELPIAIISVPPLGPVSQPIWGSWLLSDPMVEDFENTGNTPVDLASRQTVSGHRWQAGRAVIGVSTGDFPRFGL